MKKTVYKIDSNGYFAGLATVYESPQEPGKYLIPENCVEVVPLLPKLGYKAKWNGTAWEQERILSNSPGVQPLTIEELRTQKVEMVNRTCESTIYAGIDAELSAGAQHFALTPNDQTNIDSMFAAVTLGATEYPYHADGEKCVLYSAADILALYVAYKSFVTYQTTYCNFLKIWINREEDRATLDGITYGAELPEDLAAEMQTILAAAQTQIQAVASKLIQAQMGANA